MQTESVGVLDLDVNNFSDQVVVAFKHDNLVCARSTH